MPMVLDPVLLILDPVLFILYPVLFILDVRDGVMLPHVLHCPCRTWTR